jgi:OOP family OmpA-OmpF porin
MRARRIAGAAALVALGLSRPALAQVGFDVDRFDPSERGSEWFAMDSLDLRGHLRLAAGIVGDFAYRPLVLYNPDGSLGASIVRNQYFLHPGGSIVLWDRLRFGVNVPIAVFEDGRTETVRGTTYPAPTSAAMGDVRLGADVRLLGEYGRPFTLAFGAQVFLPSGSRPQYTGDGTVRLLPRLQAAGQVGVFMYAVRVGFDYRPLSGSFDGSQLGSDLLFGAAAGVKVLGDRVVLGPELSGSTILTSGQGPFKTPNTPYEILFGGHALLARDWRFGAAIGPGLSRGLGSPEIRVLGSIEWAPGPNRTPADRDQDDVPDAEDACPDIPGVRTSDPKTNGCPPALPADRDGDGIPDDKDACPDVPGVRTADPTTNGCPADRDRDGVPDALDACPDTPGIRTADPKTNGCPDRDKDAVPDTVDACPDVPGVKTDDPKTNGCPSDRDKDGIPDTADACPDSPGPPNADPKKNGCPMAVVQKGQIRIMDQIKFRLNSADIDPASDPILEAVRKVLVENPDLRHVRVEGHTDNTGNAAYNLLLSKKRARSVMTWLVKHGIESARLESQGYGMTRPVADNATDEGRRDNRRVEFHLSDVETMELEEKK